MTPLISVIIPTYQRENTLEKAVSSVLQQDYQNLEIIIVDDHSTDSTPELVRTLQDRDPRIQYVRMEVNAGPAGARNAGVANSNGDYIAFLDSDDEWLPEKLKHQVEILEVCSEAGMVFTDCRLIDSNSGQFRKLSSINTKFLTDLTLTEVPGKPEFYILEGPVQQTLFQKFFIVISSVVMRKTYFYLINGFDKRRFGTEDIDFFFRLIPYCLFIYWDMETVQKRIDDSGISKVNERWLLENIRYYIDCLFSKEYSHLYPLTIWNLKRFYEHLLLHYGIKWQPLKACSLFMNSLHYLVSLKLAFLTILSFFGPLPLIFYNLMRRFFKR